jgi:hypothetical protein
VARQQLTRPPGLVDRLRDRLAPLVPAAQMQPEMCSPASAIFTARCYLGATRLLGPSASAWPGSVAITASSSPSGETNMSKLGPCTTV